MAKSPKSTAKCQKPAMSTEAVKVAIKKRGELIGENIVFDENVTTRRKVFPLFPRNIVLLFFLNWHEYCSIIDTIATTIIVLENMYQFRKLVGIYSGFLNGEFFSTVSIHSRPSKAVLLVVHPAVAGF